MPRYINADKLKSWWTERYNTRDTVGGKSGNRCNRKRTDCFGE